MKKKILLLAPELDPRVRLAFELAGYDVLTHLPGARPLVEREQFEAVVLEPQAGNRWLEALIQKRLRACSTQRRTRLRIGLAYNVKRPGGGQEQAEFDAPATIDALREAIASYGYEVVDLEAAHDFPTRLEEAKPDFVFNIAEGWHGRSREGQVPSLLEFEAIAFSGSDSVAVSLTLDKILAKKLVAQAGFDTPRFQTFSHARERLQPELRFPLIVKPAAEGSSKGIRAHAVVCDPDALAHRVRECLAAWRQPALVEEYIVGREFTVAVLGNSRPVVLPVLEVAFNDKAGPFPVYSYEIKQEIVAGASYLCPAPIDAGLRRRLEKRARDIYRALELRDVARLDFRLGRDGTPYFLEANPLPGMTPGYSDLCLIAHAAGLSYRELVGYILCAGLKRAGFPKRHLPDLPPLVERLGPVPKNPVGLP